MTASVIVTTYNGERYIIAQLESILEQSVMPDEVLILDDVSRDNTVNVVNDFIIKNNLTNWTIVQNKTNVGWRRNFMQGAWQSTGDYVFFCDQDDLWDSKKIEIMLSIMKKNPTIKLLTSRFIEFESEGVERLLPETIENDIIKQPICSNLFKMNYPGCTFCASRSLINDSHKVWDEKDPHDALLWRMSMMTDGLYTCKNVLIRRRKHGDNTYDVERDRKKTIKDYEEWLDYAENSIRNLRAYINDVDVKELSQKECILSNTLKWIKLRRGFIINRRLFDGIQLLKFINCYLGKKSYLTDWKLFINPNSQLGESDTLA